MILVACRWYMPEFLIIVCVVAVFLGVFYLVTLARDRKLAREDDREQPPDKKAA
jgi:hypothetical protein